MGIPWNDDVYMRVTYLIENVHFNAARYVHLKFERVRVVPRHYCSQIQVFGRLRTANERLADYL